MKLKPPVSSRATPDDPAGLGGASSGGLSKPNRAVPEWLHNIELCLIPAVYGGRLITFGFQYLSGEDLTRSLPFREKMARAFLWGAQLGWIRIESIMAENARNEAEFLRNPARARQGGHAFLLNGRFLGEVAVSGDNPRLTGEGTARGGTPILKSVPEMLLAPPHLPVRGPERFDVGIEEENV